MYAVPPHFISSLSGSATVTTGDPAQALKMFEQSSYPGVWPHLDKADILQDIQVRLDSPASLMEGQPFLSGVAAVLFNVLRKNPFRYVRLCHSLFETGGFQTLRQRIQSSERLRGSSIGHYGSYQDSFSASTLHNLISPVDWMMLMTLYEAQLSSFPPPAIHPFMPSVITQHQQMTKPWELKGWLRDILGYQKVTYHHAHLQPIGLLMRRAKKAIAHGGVAIALVNAEQWVRALQTYPSWLAEADGKSTLPQCQHYTTSMLADTLPKRTPDSWVTITHIQHLPPWHAIARPSSSFAFTFHCRQECISVRLNQAPLSQSCWGMLIATP